MLNYSPWLIGRKSAANMTQRNSKGQSILQKKRAKGTFTPSEATLAAQAIAGAAWPRYAGVKGFANAHVFGLPPGNSAANNWYKKYYELAAGDDDVTPTTAHLAELPVAKGSMSITPFSTVPVADLSLATVTWSMPTSVLDSTQSGSDELHAVAWNVTRNTFTYLENGGGRSGWGTLSMVLPSLSQVGDTIVVYTTAKSVAFPTGPESVSDSIGSYTTVVA